MDAGLAAIIGVALGAVLTHAVSYAAWINRRRKVEIAVALELRRAVREIDSKMDWLQRPLPQKIIETQPKGVVDVGGGKFLFLGENETFSVLTEFWDDQFSEIVSLVKEDHFIAFAKTFDQVDRFARKFAQLKNSFHDPIGDAKVMAVACYNDLCQIHAALRQGKAAALLGHLLGNVAEE